MLTVEEAKRNTDKVRFEGTRLKIMAYINIEKNHDKIFTKKDLTKVFDVSSYRIAKSLRWLAERGIIGKIKIGRMVYYGSNGTIDDIERF